MSAWDFLDAATTSVAQKAPQNVGQTTLDHGADIQDDTGQQNTSLTQNLATVVQLLHKTPRHEPLSILQIAEKTGIIVADDVDLLTSLKTNPNIEILSDGRFRYNAKYDVKDKHELLIQLRLMTRGIPVSEIADAYPGCKTDIDELVQKGQIIRVRNIDTVKSDIIFPRLEPMHVQLSGTVSVTQGLDFVETTSDLRHEVFRGDAVKIGDIVYRVSKIMKQSANSFVPAPASGAVRATGGQYTASHTEKHDMRGRSKIQYKEPFTANRLPLDRPYEGLTADNVEIFKFGAHADLRILWKDTVSHHPKHFRKFPQTHEELRSRLTQIGLDKVSRIDNSMLKVRTFQKQSKRGRRRTVVRRKSNSASDANKHLEGTALGAQIEQARREREYEKLKAAHEQSKQQ